jgi:hypothetical protein
MRAAGDWTAPEFVVRRVELEGNPNAPPGLPDEATTFSCGAVKQVESRRKKYLVGQLQAGAARGVVDNVAIDYGRSRADNYLGGA